MKHASWIAPLLSLAGFISYYSVFYRYPVFRDFPWINLPIIFLALVLAVVGTIRFWKSSSIGKRILSTLSTLFCTGIAALFCFYVFQLSYQMPKAEQISEVATVPDFQLTSSTGETVTLANFEGRKVLISFYRGYW